MSAPQRTLLLLTLYAIAMAQVEASLVVHLRSLYYPDDPLALFPLSLMSHRDLFIELTRELATLLMILAVSMLATRGFTRGFAAFVYIFGLWDVFYYLWLKLMIGWPVSWLEWDVLFLIPWPWFAPWITPVFIALLFIFWGGWILLVAGEAKFSRNTVIVFVLGMLLDLGAFLLPAVPLLPGGEEAFQNFQPQDFSWSLYLAGYLLMAAAFWSVAKTHRHSIG